MKNNAARCEDCMNYEYDEDYECYMCSLYLDEDEVERISAHPRCPYFRFGDEYTIVRKQN